MGITNILLLAAAIATAETNGRNDLVGAAGEQGPLHITRAYLQDVNQHYGTRYSMWDMRDQKKATDVLAKYCALYCTVKRLGREPTLEDYARVHHGGPDGWRKPGTRAYWQRVNAILRASCRP